MKITKKNLEKNYILEVTEDELLELDNGMQCAYNERQHSSDEMFNSLDKEFEKYIEYGRIKE